MDEWAERRYGLKTVCPWCRKRVGMDPARWLEFHPEPQAEWAARPPECIGSGLRLDVVQDYADAREAAGGATLRLRAHP